MLESVRLTAEGDVLEIVRRDEQPGVVDEYLTGQRLQRGEQLARSRGGIAVPMAKDVVGCGFPADVRSESPHVVDQEPFAVLL
ncbi:hypothetical protein GCM10022287_01270 [Gryllotalpicola koreensis]|uniref:Uncharacterized protein n=1 Tax=Gryllotalpicola koreensis TaxID=993086 RepID=A0ABP7ZPW2_9MICO